MESELTVWCNHLYETTDINVSSYSKYSTHVTTGHKARHAIRHRAGKNIIPSIRPELPFSALSAKHGLLDVSIKEQLVEAVPKVSDLRLRGCGEVVGGIIQIFHIFLSS